MYQVCKECPVRSVRNALTPTVSAACESAATTTSSQDSTYQEDGTLPVACRAVLSLHVLIDDLYITIEGLEWYDQPALDSYLDPSPNTTLTANTEVSPTQYPLPAGRNLFAADGHFHVSETESSVSASSVVLVDISQTTSEEAASTSAKKKPAKKTERDPTPTGDTPVPKRRSRPVPKEPLDTPFHARK